MGAVLDHVAVAVRAVEDGLPLWRDELGGGLLPVWDGGSFVARQLRYPGGAKVELIAPGRDGGGFVGGFLDRFGPGLQHLTVKVDDLDATLDALRAAGLDVVDEDRADPWWHEAFLRPSQVGGIVVQVAWTPETDDEWAARVDADADVPRPGAARVLGATLAHPDPSATARWWRPLGAEVGVVDDGGVTVRWPGSALDVRVVPGERPGAVGVRVRRSADAEVELLC